MRRFFADVGVAFRARAEVDDDAQFALELNLFVFLTNEGVQEEGIFSLYSSSSFGIWMIMKLEETKQNEKEIKSLVF